MIVLFFQALTKFFTDSAESLKKFALEKIFPKARSYFLFLIFLSFLALIPPVFFFYAGVHLESIPLILFSGVWSAIFLLIFMAAASPLIALYQTLQGSAKEIIPRTLGAIEAVFITKLILTLLACFIPFENNLPLVPVYLFSSLLFGLLFAQIFKKEVVFVIVTLIFLGITASFFFLGTISSLYYHNKERDDDLVTPVRPNVTCANYDRIPYFFARDGKPKFLYRINDEGNILLFLKQTDQRVIDPATGEILLELDNKMLQVFRENMRVICKNAAIAKEIRIKLAQNELAAKYVQRYSLTNDASLQDIAVLIIDLQNGTDIVAHKEISAYFHAPNANVVDFFFSRQFVADGIFEKIFQGDQDAVTNLRLIRHVDYILLGKKYSKPVTNEFLQSSGNHTAGVSIEIRLISAQSGETVETFTAYEEGVGLSTDSAEESAIGMALNRINIRLHKFLT